MLGSYPIGVTGNEDYFNFNDPTDLLSATCHTCHEMFSDDDVSNDNYCSMRDDDDYWKYHHIKCP